VSFGTLRRLECSSNSPQLGLEGAHEAGGGTPRSLEARGWCIEELDGLGKEYMELVKL
jgi:hypothetical protein